MSTVSPTTALVALVVAIVVVALIVLAERRRRTRRPIKTPPAVRAIFEHAPDDVVALVLDQQYAAVDGTRLIPRH